MSEIRENPVDHHVLDVVRQRWSPVAFRPDPVDPAALARILEAGRWAASSYNEQPWRFLVARRENEAAFAAALECLVEGNRAWAQYASVLIFVCAEANYAHNGKPNAHAWFDSGQALAQMVLQATADGLHAHSMGGYDPDRTRELFAIDPGAETICAVAFGHLDDGSRLPEESAARDRSPRKRRPLSEIVFEGRWGAAIDLA